MKFILFMLSFLIIPFAIANGDLSEPKYVPIYVTGDIGVAKNYMNSINQQIVGRQSFDEWEVFINFEETKGLKEFKKFCPECIEVNPIPVVPTVEPSCDKNLNFWAQNNLKLTSNTSYIHQKMSSLKNIKEIPKFTVKYKTQFPENNVKILGEIFKDCESCIEVDPEPIVPVVLPIGDPC
jgi:hypothetical protein